jgi:hypothetical protein
VLLASIASTTSLPNTHFLFLSSFVPLPYFTNKQKHTKTAKNKPTCRTGLKCAIGFDCVDDVVQSADNTTVIVYGDSKCVPAKCRDPLESGTKDTCPLSFNCVEGVCQQKPGLFLLLFFFFSQLRSLSILALSLMSFAGVEGVCQQKPGSFK